MQLNSYLKVNDERKLLLSPNCLNAFCHFKKKKKRKKEKKISESHIQEQINGVFVNWPSYMAAEEVRPQTDIIKQLQS